jgi:hypothetical protein
MAVSTTEVTYGNGLANARRRSGNEPPVSADQALPPTPGADRLSLLVNNFAALDDPDSKASFDPAHPHAAVSVVPASPDPGRGALLETDFAHDKTRLNVGEHSPLSGSISSYQSGSSHNSFCAAFMRNEECQNPTCVYHNAQLDDEGVESPRRLSYLQSVRSGNIATHAMEQLSIRRQSTAMSSTFEMTPHPSFPSGLSRQSSMRSTGTYASIATLPTVPRSLADMRHVGDIDMSNIPPGSTLYKLSADGSSIVRVTGQYTLQKSMTSLSATGSVAGDHHLFGTRPPPYSEPIYVLQSQNAPAGVEKHVQIFEPQISESPGPSGLRRRPTETSTLSVGSDIPSRNPSWRPGGESLFSARQGRRHSSVNHGQAESPQTQQGPVNGLQRRRQPRQVGVAGELRASKSDLGLATSARARSQSYAGPSDPPLTETSPTSNSNLDHLEQLSPTQPRNSPGSPSKSTNRTAIVNNGLKFPESNEHLTGPEDGTDDMDYSNGKPALLNGRNAKAKAYSKLFRDMCADYMQEIGELESRVAERDHIILALRKEVEVLKNRLNAPPVSMQSIATSPTITRTPASPSHKEHAANFIFPPLTLSNVQVLRSSLHRRLDKLRQQGHDLRKQGTGNDVRKHSLDALGKHSLDALGLGRSHSLPTTMSPPVKKDSLPPLQIPEEPSPTTVTDEVSPVTVQMSRSQNTSSDSISSAADLLARRSALPQQSITAFPSVATFKHPPVMHRVSRSLGEYDTLEYTNPELLQKLMTSLQEHKAGQEENVSRRGVLLFYDQASRRQDTESESAIGDERDDYLVESPRELHPNEAASLREQEAGESAGFS